MKLKNFFKKILKKNKNNIPIEKKQTDVWLITGCSSGIGYELCTELLKKGYKVAAGLRKKERLNKLKEEFPENLLPLEIDVTNEEQTKKAIEEAISYFGKIDVLVNNAGISFFGAIEETKISDVKRIFETNFIGYVITSKYILPHFRQNRDGLIINISSVCGIEAYPGVTFYSASKFAIEAFSEALRKEVKPLGISVLNVNLSAARTPLTLKVDLKKPSIVEYQEILKNSYDVFFNQLEYKESKICPQKLVKAIIYQAENFRYSSLYLGSECLNIAKNKYLNMLKNVEKQMENPFDVEYC